MALPLQAARAQAAPGDAFTSLYSFAGGSADGAQPSGALVSGPNGAFYGTTETGGEHGYGTAYMITASGTETLLHSFSAADGEYPTGPLVLAGDGNFYGTAQAGGASDKGALFEMTPAGVVTAFYSFSGSTDGATPINGLALGGDGALYGTAYAGGAHGDGSVYKITLAKAFTEIHSFNASVDGDEPYGTLCAGTDGNLYGTASIGGSHNAGTAFSVTSSGAFKLLHSFNGAAEGLDAFSGLALGTDGNFYGLAYKGGANGTGDLYRMTPSGAVAPVYSFTAASASGENADGGYNSNSLIVGTDGNFYGASYQAGPNNTGAVFEVTPAGAETTLYGFGADASGAGSSGGANPGAALLEDKNGMLIGTAIGGGSSDAGNVFTVTVASLNSSAAPGPQQIGSGLQFDYNGDGHNDLLWYNSATGQASFWNTSDQTVLAYGGAFAQIAPSTGWQPAVSVDVDGDGFPDLVWWNSRTGELSAWTIQNDAVKSYGGDFSRLADTNWKPVAAADVVDNAHGSPTLWSLVFQNQATGAISRWEMQGTQVIAYGGALASSGANSHEQIVGAPDLDGNGHSDLVFWNDQTGDVSYWSMNLTQSKVLSYNRPFTALSDTSWHLVSTEDTNGDGEADLVWWNANTGVVSRWLLSGSTVTQYGAATAQVTDTAWQPTALR